VFCKIIYLLINKITEFLNGFAALKVHSAQKNKFKLLANVKISQLFCTFGLILVGGHGKWSSA